MFQRKKEIDDRANCQPPVSDEEAKELAAIEAELASLTPGPSRLDRDRTMFLAGQASAGSKTTPTVSTLAASTLAARRWPIGFAAMTAVAGCLLVVLIVQQQTVIALRATMPTTTIESTMSPGQSTEPPIRQAVADDFERQDFERQNFERRGFDFSNERLLALADLGPLTVRSLFTMDKSESGTASKSAPPRNWPTQTYEPPSPPLPYYKLLRQLTQREYQ